MKPFDLKDPEGHLERVEKNCLKKGLKRDEDKAVELVRTFTRGDAKTMYRVWVDEQEKPTVRGPGFKPTFEEIADWLRETYGEGKKTFEDLRSIVDKSKEKRWTAERFRNKFTEAYEKREASITDAEGVKLFVKGLPTRVREVLESNKELFDDRDGPARRVDRKGKGRVGSDDSGSEKSERSSESTSSSDSSEALSEESTSEEEENGRGWGRKEIEKLKEEKAREERLRAEKGGASSGGDMSELTAQMKALALTVNELAKRPATTTSAKPLQVQEDPLSATETPQEGLWTPTEPRNCYVCDSTEHQTRICPVFDEMIKLGWPLKKENGYVVVRTEDGRATGRGGWIRERGNRGSSSPKNSRIYRRRKDGEAGKISIDARIGGEVTPVVRTILRAKNVSLFEVELARAHLEIKTGYRGRGVMPLDDFIGVVGGMSERQRGCSGETTRKNAKLRVAEESGSAMSLDEDAARRTAGENRGGGTNKGERRRARVSWGPKESVSVKRMGRGTEVLKPVDKGRGDGNKAVTGAAEEKRGSTFRYLSQLQEGIPNASREIAESILNTPVMVTAGQLLSMSGVRKEIQKVTNLRKMEYLERTLFGAVGEARFVEMDIGDAWHGEADAEEVDEEETREDGYSRLERVGEEGRRNDLRKWPKIRPLVTQSPHLTEGPKRRRVPNELGVKRAGKRDRERGVSIHWGFTFNMRSANGTIDKLEGMIPNLPVFVGGVRFEISALVVGDNAPFALLWGSPANQAAATRTVRDPRTKEMTVWMQNPEGFSVFYTALQGYDSPRRAQVILALEKTRDDPERARRRSGGEWSGQQWKWEATWQDDVSVGQKPRVVSWSEDSNDTAQAMAHEELSSASSIIEKLIGVLREKLESGVAEPSCGAYSSRWTYSRLMRSQFSTSLLTPHMEDITQRFAARGIIRHLTVTATLIKYRWTRRAEILQRWGRRWVAEDDGLTARMDKLADKGWPFIDDMPLRGKSVEEWDGTMDEYGVRASVREHIEDIDGVLGDAEEAGITFSGAKTRGG
ncbi:hypothetical protein BC829DRAFT_450401 [Chytridium lagenaria]|nr:hypothetical protein BC829DRAFT_450401 [Chytridium lagenaria]